MSGIEDKLGVKNGFPVPDGPTRDSATPDYDADWLRYQALGQELATEYSLLAAFDELFAAYALRGMGAKAAFDEAMRTLGIANTDDFIYYTDEDHGR